MAVFCSAISSLVGCGTSLGDWLVGCGGDFGRSTFYAISVGTRQCRVRRGVFV
ncbi:MULTISPECIES: hypothetical protein [unclassified Microcoleus]|uniref:hypothetical protein n=1 Tax=unclassified Microcoleus TaxID=2642155 RepID=UPI002FD5B6D2